MFDRWDCTRSTSRWTTKAGEGKNLEVYLEVKGLGILKLNVSSSLGDPKGRIIPDGMSLVEFSRPSSEPPSAQ